MPNAQRKTWRWVMTAAVGTAFIAGVIYATSATLSAGDTWIALAAGRQISATGYGHFPKADSFSYSFTGRQWTNQNWLSHVIIWWLYDRLCPTATVAFEIVLLAVAGLLVAAATRITLGRWSVGALAAVVVFVVSFNYFDIRPAMASHVSAMAVYVLLLAGTFHALGWLAAIPLVMAFWGNAHGSFPLGFLIMLAWAVGMAIERWRSRGHALRQDAVRVSAVLLAAAVSAAVVVFTSPFGIENLLHPFVVVRSPRFREIIEWAPAYDLAVRFPPIIPFFILLIWLGLFVGLWFLRGPRQLVDATIAANGVNKLTRSCPERRILASEVLVALLGIAVATYSRRFIPTGSLLAMPLVCKMLWQTLGRGGHPIPETLAGASGSDRVIGVLASLMLVAIVGIGGGQIAKGYTPVGGRLFPSGLFERRVNIANEPTDIVQFAKSQGVSGRLFVQWDWAGYCMFNWPESPVFIDGRSQALYSEEAYRLYHKIEQMKPPATPQQIVEHGLRVDRLLSPDRNPSEPRRRPGAELLLMKRFEQPTAAVFTPLISTGRWVPLYANEIGMLLARREGASGSMQSVLLRYEQLALDWPTNMWGYFSKALAAQSIAKPDFAVAIECYHKAIELGVRSAFYGGIAQCYVQLGRTEELRQFFTSELQRLGARADRDSGDVRDSIQMIRQVLGMSH